MTLPVAAFALRFTDAVEEVAKRLPPRRQYLATQMRRAVSSVYLNLREGIGEFKPGEKARFYRMSFRSLAECLGALGLAVRFHPDLKDWVDTATRLGCELRPKIHRMIVYQRRRPEA